MKEFSAEHSFDPQLLDRLVDGELDGARRRELLEALDRQSGGWRQCALAFLEAQSWGDALTDYVRAPAAIEQASGAVGTRPTAPGAQPVVSAQPAVEAAKHAQADRHFSGWVSWAGMAASFWSSNGLVRRHQAAARACCSSTDVRENISPARSARSRAFQATIWL